jgi:iron complex outermembrane receptor protein
LLTGIFVLALTTVDVTAVDSVFELPALEVEAAHRVWVTIQSEASVNVVNQGEVQQGELQLSLAESLSLMPGVFVMNPDNYAQDTRIAIRGFGARADFGIRGIRLFLDGLPLTTPDGQGEVDGLDLGSIEEIRVLRGPISALYGSASGGVILMSSEEGRGPAYWETRLTTGQTGLRQMQFKAAEGTGKLRSIISGGYLERTGYRGHSETRQMRLNGNVVFRPDARQQLRLLFNVIDYPLQNDPGGLTLAEYRADPSAARDRNVQYDSGEWVRQERLGMRYVFETEDAFMFSATAYHADRQFANRLPFTNGGQVTYGRQFDGGNLLLRFDWDLIRLSVGTEYSRQSDQRRNYDNVFGTRGPLRLDQLEQVQSRGTFALLEGGSPLGVDWKVGWREESVRFAVRDKYLSDGDDSGRLAFLEGVPFLGLAYPIGKDSRIFLNYSTGFETPTTTELDNPDGGGFSQGLEPQTARSWEFGWEGTVANRVLPIEWKLAVFDILIDNVLVPYELESSPGREFFRNAGSSSRKGIEAQIGLQLTHQLSLNAQITFSDFRYREFVANGQDLANKRLPGIPQSYAGLALRYTPVQGAFMEWETRLVGTLFADDANHTQLDAYTVSDFKFGWSFRQGSTFWEPFITLNNIFNADYAANVRINASFARYYEPAAGRAAFIGLRIRFGGTDYLNTGEE